MSIYNKIKTLISEKNLTIKDVESRCGLSNGLIKKWEKSIPKADILYKVAKELDVPLEYFLTDSYSSPTFSQDELQLIDAYRKLDLKGKSKVLNYIFEILDAIEVIKSTEETAKTSI